MKNRKKAVFAAAAVLAILFLAACGSKADSGLTSESGEMVVPEISSEDLLVSSLEYLLEEEEETQDLDVRMSDEQETQGEADEADAQDIPEESGDMSPDTQMAEAVIYYGNGGSADLNEETIEIEEITPDVLIDALARHNIVTLLDTKVLSFAEEELGGEKLLYLDLSKAFGEYLNTMSKEAECIIVSSLANTFLENYDADGIYITVEGKTMTTSSMEYAEPIRRCTPEEIAELSGAADEEKEAADPMQDGAEETERKQPSVEEKQ